MNKYLTNPPTHFTSYHISTPPKTLKQVQGDELRSECNKLNHPSQPVIASVSEAIRKRKSPMQTKKAFTLAEIMIVLMVIGILTAILLPSARNATPDELAMKFKKNNIALSNAVSELINSDEYFANGDYGIDKNGNIVNNPKYFCGVLADVLTAKKVECSDDDLGYNSSAVANFPDLLTYEIDGNSIYDLADCMCANNLTAGEEIILNDDTIIYSVNPYYHFGSLTQSGSSEEKRLFNLCSDEKRYKYICMDLDGLNHGEPPFGYALRADGKIVYGSRAQAWLNRSIQQKDDEVLNISSISSCAPTALAIVPEKDVCSSPVFSSGSNTSSPDESVEFGFTYTGSYSNPTENKIVLNSSGIFKTTANRQATLFIVGGGGGGGKNNGNGGNGGYINETLFTFVANTEYSVTIGAGGASATAGESTYFGTLAAEGGEAGGSAGSGGLAEGGIGRGGAASGKKGGAGLSFDGSYYAAGGGGGNGWSGGAGGSSIGGAGGSGCTVGSAGTSNTGSGGGGGGGTQDGTSCSKAGGKGGSGVVVILLSE